MNQVERENSRLSRREFLKLLAATAAGSAIGEISLVDPFLQEKLEDIFLNSRNFLVANPQERGLGTNYDIISIPAPEGYRIEGYLLYSEGNEEKDRHKKTVIFSHGYPPGGKGEDGMYTGGLWDNWKQTVEIIRNLRRRGYNVIIYTCRGHPPINVDQATGYPKDFVTFGHFETIDTFRLVRYIQSNAFSSRPLTKDMTFGFGWSGGTTSLIFAEAICSIRAKGVGMCALSSESDIRSFFGIEMPEDVIEFLYGDSEDKYGMAAMYLDSVPANMYSTFKNTFLGLADFGYTFLRITRTLQGRGFNPALVEPRKWIGLIDDSRFYMIHNIHDMFIHYEEFLKYAGSIRRGYFKGLMDRWHLAKILDRRYEKGNMMMVLRRADTIQHQAFRSMEAQVVSSDMDAFFKGKQFPDRTHEPIWKASENKISKIESIEDISRVMNS